MNPISKMLSGKHLSGKATPLTISCIKNQASINYPGILRSFSSASPYQTDFISQYGTLQNKHSETGRLKFFSHPKLSVLISSYPQWLPSLCLPPPFKVRFMFPFPSKADFICFFEFPHTPSPTLLKIISFLSPEN